MEIMNNYLNLFMWNFSWRICQKEGDRVWIVKME